MFHNILFATDLGERSEEGVSVLCTIPAASVSNITLLHVLDERSNGNNISDESSAILERQTKRLRDNGFSVEALHIRGIPFDVIVHEAQTRKASLTVIGRGSSPSWKTRILGETVLRVLELSPCPVLVCCNCSSEGELLRDVMLGIDFSNEAYTALQLLRKTAFDAPGLLRKVTLLHIHEQTNIDMLLKLVNRDQIEKIIAVERERLEEMAQNLKDAGIEKVSVRMRTGKPVDEMLSEISENKPTMAILGAQGQGRSDLYRIGTTAFRVTQLAECPVLVIPLQRPPLPM